MSAATVDRVYGYCTTCRGLIAIPTDAPGVACCRCFWSSFYAARRSASYRSVHVEHVRTGPSVPTRRSALCGMSLTEFVKDEADGPCAACEGLVPAEAQRRFRRHEDGTWTACTSITADTWAPIENPFRLVRP